MPRTLSYSDAIRLLGGQDSKLVGALEAVTGGAMLAAAVPFPAVLAWFDAKSEFVRLSHELLRGLSERRSGLSRYGRTERLEAAHAVIVVTAYFEALAESHLPFRFGDLKLTKAEQAAIVGGSASPEGPFLMQTIFSVGGLLPGPQYPYERLLETLHDYYGEVSGAVRRFVSGLAVWERLAARDRNRFGQVLAEVPARAKTRYEELFRRLGADFPEVAFWSGLRDHQATRAQVRDLGTALAGLGEMLTGISTGRLPDDRRAGLARANRAALERPVVQSGDVPAGLRVPTLAEAYMTPLFRAANAGPGARSSDESWWEPIPVRDDLERFVAGYLTGPRAVRAPLLVLGQPGSGKSVLTTVLAARLPAADFLPVRVALRDVPAAAPLQDQIEYAIRDATGERLDWPALARSAGDALPVVLLDGFDELLQATGVSQSDYLLRIADFQRREADQGRPVVVVVTSRTSVVDRANAPEGTLAVRLEPFDRQRITAWLRRWNGVNAEQFAARGQAPLEPRTVLPHPELAGQPLLLLMLALYDADGNALQRVESGMRRDELYDRLLRSFAQREVAKHRKGLPERELRRAVEDELRRLSLVAFAMFNRHSQWVAEADLTADLVAILGEPAAVTPSYELRTPLRPAEIVLGRFFFVHRARAMRDDDSRLATYEFLHATFGEFLVARLTCLVLRDMAAREAAATMSLAATPVDDDLLHALLSFSSLTTRAPIVGFITDLMSAMPGDERDAVRDLLIRLFRVVHHARPARKLAGYGPAGRTVPLRHAAYSANLVLLCVAASGRVRASELYGPQEPNFLAAWKRQALLWRSQLTWEEWTSLVGTLTLERHYDDGRRDVTLGIDDGSFRPSPVDLHWTYEVSPEDPRRQAWLTPPLPTNLAFIKRRANFLCRTSDDTIQHNFEPTMALGAALTTLVGLTPGTKVSAAQALLDLVLRPNSALPSGERERWYRQCVRVVTDATVTWPDDVRTRYAALLLDRLTTDEGIDPAVATEVINALERSPLFDPRDLGASLLRSGLRFIGDSPGGVGGDQ